ncbi:VWA domain-containing protein [Phycisphaerales bacterium AB-hyl4]|uniref:VWA domain-containing protein n=1 Tax=Natronomicrosphaera hydrolytica TaxID=3242702 RepID=A0ABV4U0L0_9BACT
MGFLSPITAMVAAALAVPALVALYFLKLRRRELAVPSTLLWRKAIQDMQVNAPFQKLRRNLLLLLQLLLLAALLVAMARPTLLTAAPPGQQVILIIDQSASMNATDGSPTRLDDAKAAALNIIDDLGSGTLTGGASEAMVIAFGERARVVQNTTTDLARLRAAVRSIQPTDQRSRLGPALQLVEPYAQRAAATDAEDVLVYVISDGRVHEEPGEPMSLPGAALVYVPMGTEAVDNVAVIAFSARRDFEQPERVQVFARLANYGAAALSPNVELRIDGRVHRAQRVELPPAGADGPGMRSVQFEFNLADEALVQVGHDHNDMLAGDDRASIVLAPPRRLRVLLVTEGNTFLERVVRSIGVRRMVAMTPNRYAAQDPERLRRGGWSDVGQSVGDEDGFDVIIFDAYAPEQRPAVNSLYFAAVPPIEDLALRAAREDERATQVVLDWQRDHPIMRHVVLDDVAMSRPGRLMLPMDADMLAMGEGGPVIATLRHEGVQHVVTAFDTLQTNWPLYVSFPVFISNVMQTLGLGSLADEAGVMYRAGEAAALPYAGDAATVSYTGPVPLSGRRSGREMVLSPFERVGVYRTTDSDVEPPFDRLAVNLLDARESDLRPAEQLQVGTRTATTQGRDATTRREVWPWFVWAALAFLMVEWLVYTRRMHI